MSEEEGNKLIVRKMEVEMEVDAQIHAQRGDNTKMIALLRKLDKREEMPDLSFIADVLEGKYKKTGGRPTDWKILAGLKARRIARSVYKLIHKQGMTVEVAVEVVCGLTGLGETTVKGHYYACLKNQAEKYKNIESLAKVKSINPKFD